MDQLSCEVEGTCNWDEDSFSCSACSQTSCAMPYVVQPCSAYTDEIECFEQSHCNFNKCVSHEVVQAYHLAVRVWTSCAPILQKRLSATQSLAVNITWQLEPVMFQASSVRGFPYLMCCAGFTPPCSQINGGQFACEQSNCQFYAFSRSCNVAGLKFDCNGKEDLMLLC